MRYFYYYIMFYSYNSNQSVTDYCTYDLLCNIYSDLFDTVSCLQYSGTQHNIDHQTQMIAVLPDEVLFPCLNLLHQYYTVDGCRYQIGSYCTIAPLEYPISHAYSIFIMIQDNTDNISQITFPSINQWDGNLTKLFEYQLHFITFYLFIYLFFASLPG